jgi:RNA polymerase sigma factor (sigma-70 family)
MASGPIRAVLRQVHRIFQGETTGGLSEWQLLHRYVDRRDESAFEALVARHGPMVLGVCRRMLNDPSAVEDAFQATFLVLVRKARSLGEHDAIGHWLYGVAYRVALRARSESARRRTFEKQTLVREWDEPTRREDPDRADLTAILDGELNRLPSTFRVPVVLCFLEGLTHEEAAQQLHWPVGTVKGRLARAKELLRSRLARRGVLPSAGLLLTILNRDASAAVPQTLLQATVHAAAQLTMGRAVSGVLSATVVHLMEGTISTMYATKIKTAVVLFAACGGLALGGWTLAQQAERKGQRSGDNRASAKTSQTPENSPKRVSVETAQTPDLEKILSRPIAFKFKETRLEDVIKQVRENTRTQDYEGIPIYVDEAGLQEAGASLEALVTIETQNTPLEASLDAVLRPLKLGAATRDGLLVISSRQEIILIELRKLNHRLGEKGVSPTISPPPPNSSRGRGPSPPPVDPDEIDTKVAEALNKRCSVKIQNLPVEKAIEEIRKLTISDAFPKGVPIYQYPVVSAPREGSSITIELESVKLRTILRLVLEQVGLSYAIDREDGLLLIGS